MRDIGIKLINNAPKFKLQLMQVVIEKQDIMSLPNVII